MRMTIDPQRVAPMLRQEAVEMVNGAERNVTLDFSGLRRIDSNAVTALEELAALADIRSVHITLQAVNTDIYKVLRLLNLTGRFS
jgi:ABC-type transporter Mla MlaB component